MTKQNFVDLMGSESEGFFTNPDDRIIHDGSVGTGRASREHCTCYDYCECEECERCSLCGEQISYCDCWDCLTCDECYEHMESCGCSRHRTDCNDSDCITGMTCDECNEAWTRNHSNYDCAEMSHIENNCQRNCDCECECDEEEGMDGELPSPPLNVQELMSYQNRSGNYPTYVNHTCGFHVHASLINRKVMAVLMDRSFHDYLKEQSKVWGKNMRCKNKQFWERIDGENTFCHDRYRGFEQIMATEHYHEDRYTFVNYCYNLHKTVEIRVAPAFKQSKMASLWVKFVYDIINKFLRNMNTSLVSYTNGREFVNPR